MTIMGVQNIQLKKMVSDNEAEKAAESSNPSVAKLSDSHVTLLSKELELRLSASIASECSSSWLGNRTLDDKGVGRIVDQFGSDVVRVFRQVEEMSCDDVSIVLERGEVDKNYRGAENGGGEEEEEKEGGGNDGGIAGGEISGIEGRDEVNQLINEFTSDDKNDTPRMI
jgi:hypothetical protein